jgi:hypothetical protein
MYTHTQKCFLTTNTHVEFLQLVGTGLTAEACLPLGLLCQRSSTLKFLSLDYNPLTDAGAAAVVSGCAAASKSAFTKISLKYCELGVLAARALGDLLARDTPLA